ncbi:hypothetical protein BDY19DRAFT_981765 [Irpex rosettiformis]|uniref:Uncharacterized protein n=1 Tax=Irpex rosettiformis TaxID=378272 RepID=A0ACB8UIU4_9APHY|nr:hypothetical protein BDY19DRAFT_981765 [Irpex rosettiformis]
MAPVRLRHPKGAKVYDLHQEIFAVTEIPPSLQESADSLFKSSGGYPPHGLTLIPELPIESLGLKQGEQLIVAQNAEASRAHRPAATAQAGVGDSPAGPMTGLTASQVPDSISPSPGPSGPDYVLTEGRYLVHRIVPDDNSCLFSSVAFVFEQSISKASEIRKNPSSWGGAIELTILAKHYSTEIASVDVETGRIDKFTPTSESDKGNRCIHGDAATIALILDAPHDFHRTVMPRVRQGDDDPTLVAAKKLADKLQAKRAYTNTSTFDL